MPEALRNTCIAAGTRFVQVFSSDTLTFRARQVTRKSKVNFVYHDHKWQLTRGLRMRVRREWWGLQHMGGFGSPLQEAANITPADYRPTSSNL